MDKNKKTFTTRELSEIVNGELRGDPELEIREIARLDSVGRNQIAFVDDLKALGETQRDNGFCLIVERGADVDGTVIFVDHPKLAFAKIGALLAPAKTHAGGIHQSATVAASAMIDRTAWIDSGVTIGVNSRLGQHTIVLAGTVVGDDVQIGDDCVINPNCVIYDRITVGNRVILHAGVVIGADGFGYVRAPEAYYKFPQVGTVFIEDDVEIGANSCVDRGALGPTRIGRGTKIDNLVQIAHNVQIGERVVIAAQTGISGSTVIEDDAVIGGQVGMGDHARVMSGAVIGSQAGVLPGKIVREGVWWGTPVQRLEDYKRLNAHINKLPRLREEVKQLRKELDELKQTKGRKD